METPNHVDTIVAQATPRGRGGVGVVRVSGPLSAEIAQRLLKAQEKLPIRKAIYGSFWDEEQPIDQGIALLFKAPHSFTGEDVLELQGHGSPVVMDVLVRKIASMGARLARPGEFSERAFMNNKLDLVQAEAVAELIHAQTEQAARSAVRSLQGLFSEKIAVLVQGIIAVRMYIEASLDFPDEDIELLEQGQIFEKLATLTTQFEAILSQAKSGTLLSEGICVVLAGEPNAGKSSLMNRLAGEDKAIVTEIPGTTRDVLKTQVSLDGLLVELSDTAGLRESTDIVEQEGIKRARQALEKADHIFWVVDATAVQPQSSVLKELQNKIPITLVYNKVDLVQNIKQDPNNKTIYVSAKTGEGIDQLITHLKEQHGFSESGEGNFIARRRHVEALRVAYQQVLQAQATLKQTKLLELAAEDLRLAQQSLDEITGKFTSDDLLGKIFSEFCIGK